MRVRIFQYNVGYEVVINERFICTESPIKDYNLVEKLVCNAIANKKCRME